jgi:hypothetical protein
MLAEQVILADHLAERGRPQAIGERPRRALAESGSFE